MRAVPRRVCVLDDYQGVALSLADWSTIEDRVSVDVWREHVDDEDELAATLRPFEIVVAMRERTAFPRSLIERLRNLELLVTTGPYNAVIDLDAAADHGIQVCGTRGRLSPTYELTWGLILACVKQIPQNDRIVGAGGWQTLIGGDVEGARLGVLGLGRLGGHVAAHRPGLRCVGVRVVTGVEPFVTCEVVHPGVHLMRLDRPDRLNALGRQMIDQILEALRTLGDDPGCRVVILTGAGRAFSAGADLKGEPGVPSSVERGPVATFDSQKRFSELTLTLRAIPQPVIAAVNGPATGGGLALVLASDLRYAAAAAVFGASFARIGLSGCDMGTSWILSRLVGVGRAHEMMLTGRLIDAEEALSSGLVLDVVPDGTVVERALSSARLILENSPFGVRMTKEVMWSTLEIPALRTAIDLENRTQVLAGLTDDSQEATEAFLQRRPPSFRGS